METNLHISLFQFKCFIFFFLIFFIGNAQDIQVNILGGGVISNGGNQTITAGTSLSFRITNSKASSSCGLFDLLNDGLDISEVTISDTSNFEITPSSPSGTVYPSACENSFWGSFFNSYLDFKIKNTSPSCSVASTTFTIKAAGQTDFTFTLKVDSSPIINVLGGDPSADIHHGDTTTSDTNGTYFGVVEEGASVIRNYVISNTGSCPLYISAISSTLTEFTVGTLIESDGITQAALPASVAPGDYVVLPVRFTGSADTPGTKISTISITNNDNTTFSFNVSAELFNYNIPGPGGITSNFRLWLKANRGVTKDGASKVSVWADLGTNDKDAIAVSGNEPTYIDNTASNINFNPVIKFENDGSTTNQYLYNSTNGFYSQDIFIVVKPESTIINSSPRNTIFAGKYSNSIYDMTGIGFGNYSSKFTNETLSYNQGSPEEPILPSLLTYYSEAEKNTSYSNAGIINVRNNAGVLGLLHPHQDILYNSNVLSTSNVGFNLLTMSSNFNSEYWIGKNANSTYGNLNGRVAEIFTFAERLDDTDRQKVESYLAIKYGITLGASDEAEKDYVNSFGTGNTVWDISANSGTFNYDVAGIGRDDSSDLNQKQSKTVNRTDEVTIGLGGIYDTNSANPNEFEHNGDFFVWGNNNGSFSGANTNTVTIGTGVTTSVTRMDRTWKIVETNETTPADDVDRLFVSIPSASFDDNGFTKTADEEYALIVADNSNFDDGDIIDVIPLRADGSGNLQTWYDFDGTEFFTFGKVAKLTENHAVTIGANDYLLGEYDVNLNINDFTISAWVKADNTQTATRTIMAKGEKLEMRLNGSQQVEMIIDDINAPKFTSDMTLDDNKWHQVTFVYDSGTAFLYVDGVLDKSKQNIEPPSPNFNNYCIGALYKDKNTVLNNFLGQIDEVYIWDQGLTQAQVRYLMNQEIEASGGGNVSGKVIPFAASSNEVASIPWSKLKVYYNFNSFYGSTVEGQASTGYFLRMNYLDKQNKSVLTDQTAPVPYVSAADGTWDNASTWENGSDIMLPNTYGADGTTLINWNIVQISHDITSGARDISLLGLIIQTTGTLTMDGVNEITTGTGTGQGLTISHYMELDGVINLEGESQLVQTEGSIIDGDSGGYIKSEQQGKANGFNYNYWSSSVGPIASSATSSRGDGTAANNEDYTISGVMKDGTDANNYQDIYFETSAYAADLNTPTSPITISSFWLHKFYGANGNYYAWEKIDENDLLMPGEGFTMKGSSGGVPLDTFQNYVFKGLPNNGNITLPLEKISGTDDVDRLIGNPYPSAMDARKFILDNLSTVDGGTNATTVFNGAIYYWDHFGKIDSHYLADYVGGYATYNLIGGTEAITKDWASYAKSANSQGPGLSRIPGPSIPVNQGFFVTTALDVDFSVDSNGDALGSAVNGGDIVFKNSQRVFVTESPVTSVFLKNKSKGTAQATTSSTMPMIRLMYDSPEGYHRQLAVGLNKKASNQFDLGYDAFMIDVNKEDMYWTFDGAKFVIQGVNNFDDTQEFPLGLIIENDGLASIKLDALENIDPNKAVYIKDNNTGETFQINTNPFEVYLEAGTYNNRFELVFKPSEDKSLSTSESDLIEGLSIYYNSQTSKLNINIESEMKVSVGTIFNLMGQKIMHVNGFSKSTSIPLQISTGVYIVQLKTDKGIVNRKVMVK